MDASAKQICGQLRGMCLPGSIQHMGIVSTLGTWPGGCRADGTVDRRSPGRETTLQRGAVRYKGKRLSSGLKSGAAVLPPPQLSLHEVRSQEDPRKAGHSAMW